jgi:hypothetical protein
MLFQIQYKMYSFVSFQLSRNNVQNVSYTEKEMHLTNTNI